MRALLLLLVLPTAAVAHQTRQLAPHVHGQATVQVGIDGGDMDIALQAPGMGILSFERAPATPTERDQLTRAIAALKAGRWIQLPAAAGCALINHQVRADGFSAGEAGHVDAEGHAHHHHAGFEAQLRYRCTAPSQLSHLQVTLAAYFPALHETVVEIATVKGQGRAVLRGAEQRVVLPQ